jgi:hypothetical protein
MPSLRSLPAIASLSLLALLVMAPARLSAAGVRNQQEGSLRATITIRNRPAAGVSCQVIGYDAEFGRALLADKAKTGADGVCRSRKLAPGSYTLEVIPPGSSSQFAERFKVIAHRETVVSIALSPIRLKGKVVQGGKPAPGVMVFAFDLGPSKPAGTLSDAAAQALTTDQGDFEMVLWSPGRYAFRSWSLDGKASAAKNVSLEKQEEKVTLDLHQVKRRS